MCVPGKKKSPLEVILLVQEFESIFTFNLKIKLSYQSTLSIQHQVDKKNTDIDR